MSKSLIYFPVVFLLMALFFLYIGLKVVLTKRPLFLSAKYFYAFMILAFSPQFVNMVELFKMSHSRKYDLLFLLSPLMFLVLLIFLWIQMKGYMAIGISDDLFREALHYSLNKLGLAFEERISTIYLTSMNSSIQIAIQSWIGAGQLKFKEAKNAKLLAEIISGMNEYNSANNIKSKNITAIFYIIIGLLILVAAGVFYYFTNSILRF